jgi:hypothetical protein
LYFTWIKKNEYKPCGALPGAALWEADAKPARGAGGAVGKFANNAAFIRKKGQVSNMGPQMVPEMENGANNNEETQEREELYQVRALDDSRLFPRH